MQKFDDMNVSNNHDSNTTIDKEKPQKGSTEQSKVEKKNLSFDSGQSHRRIKEIASENNQKVQLTFAFL